MVQLVHVRRSSGVTSVLDIRSALSECQKPCVDVADRGSVPSSILEVGIWGYLLFQSQYWTTRNSGDGLRGSSTYLDVTPCILIGEGDGSLGQDPASLRSLRDSIVSDSSSTVANGVHVARAVSPWKNHIAGFMVTK